MAKIGVWSLSVVSDLCVIYTLFISYLYIALLDKCVFPLHYFTTLTRKDAFKKKKNRKDIEFVSKNLFVVSEI